MMECVFLAIILFALSFILFEMKVARAQRSDIEKAVKNVETEVKDLKDTLNPIEKRHFR